MHLSSIESDRALSSLGLAGDGKAERHLKQIADNEARAHLPRVMIGTGDDETPPQFAYSVADLDSTWGQFRHMHPGWRRDAMERGYRQRLGALRKMHG